MAEAPTSLLGKKWPTPVARPYWPFLTAGVIMFYAISNVSTLLMNTDEYKNDPRNPNAKNALSKGH